MAKKLNKLVARVAALEKAIAQFLKGGKPAAKKTTKAKKAKKAKKAAKAGKRAVSARKASALPAKKAAAAKAPKPVKKKAPARAKRARLSPDDGLMLGVQPGLIAPLE